MSKKNEVEAEAEVDQTEFVNVDPTELMNHHRQVNENIAADQFEADRLEALEKFGPNSEGKTNAQRAKPISKQDGKFKGSPSTPREKEVAGDGSETKGTNGESGAESTADAEALTDTAAATGDAKPWEK